MWNENTSFPWSPSQRCWQVAFYNCAYVWLQPVLWLCSSPLCFPDIEPVHTVWEKDGGWCDGAGSMTTTDEVANIAAEAVEVFRLRVGQELLRLFVEGQGRISLPCFAVGPGLKIEAFVSNGDCRSQTRGWDAGSHQVGKIPAITGSYVGPFEKISIMVSQKGKWEWIQEI